jgi:hypothetical protein
VFSLTRERAGRMSESIHWRREKKRRVDVGINKKTLNGE